MTEGSRRGVTRGYVGGLTVAAVILAAALVIASWGFISLFTGRDPITTPGISRAATPLIVILALGLLGWRLWEQALALLRGRRTPPIGQALVVAVGAYLVWCLLGGILGLSAGETWLSPYAGMLIPIWTLAALLFWAVLVRRVYTDRPPPRWPWERREEREPDAPPEDDPGFSS